MMKAVVAAAVSVMLAVSAQADILRLASGGKSYVRIQTMSADAAVTHAADEFVRYMKAILNRTDYNGNQGPLLLRFALAGDESCSRADELMAEHKLDRAKLGDEGFLVATSGKNTVMLCAYTGKGVLNGVYKMFEKSFGYEIYDFKQRQNAKNPPQFSVKGKGVSEEVE